MADDLVPKPGEPTDPPESIIYDVRFVTGAGQGRAYRVASRNGALVAIALAAARATLSGGLLDVTLAGTEADDDEREEGTFLEEGVAVPPNGPRGHAFHLMRFTVELTLADHQTVAYRVVTASVERAVAFAASALEGERPGLQPVRVEIGHVEYHLPDVRGRPRGLPRDEVRGPRAAPTTSPPPPCAGWAVGACPPAQVRGPVAEAA